MAALAAAGVVKQPAPPPDVDAAEIVVAIEALDARAVKLEEDIRRLDSQLEELALWGEFQPARITDLAQRGVHVQLYRCAPRELPEPPAGAVRHIVAQDAHTVAFAIVSHAEFVLPLAPEQLPEEAPSALRARRDEYARELQETKAQLAGCATKAEVLARREEELEYDHMRAQARDQIAEHAALAALQGFVPVDAVAACRAAARDHGWGLVIENPAPGEAVPTLIRLPRVIKPIQAMFDFIDTLPGYHERDVSAVFYLFFSLFYAMIIGDAGYGAIFLLGTIAVHIWKGRSIPKTPLYLMYVLNVATIIWGMLTGTYFGMELPATAFVRKFIVLDTTNMQIMLPLCFIIAGIQLTVAHAWNALRIINRWAALAQVGWILMIWSLFFLVRMLLLSKPYPLPMAVVGVVGVIMVIVFSGALRRPMELAQLPFGFINSFADIISYMRLFAVSYAALALAQAFNSMAANIGMNSIIAGFAAAAILVLGHGLNMALSALSVLVHGLRLNMLEFSSHLGQEWTGVRYTPLRRGPRE
jgi:V/A-type H+-transporting ATPase subunit I